MLKEKKSYNDRLFDGGIREKFHLARFKWVKNQLNSKKFKNLKKIVDFGCYDGRMSDYLDQTYFYTGIDANWENGLDIAKEKYIDSKNHKFIKFVSFSDFNDIQSDVIVSLETLEHINPNHLFDYLSAFKKISNKLIITVPNEIGILFALKFVIKRIFFSPENYSLKEYILQTFGFSNKVVRDQHKGFNYKFLKREIESVGYNCIKIEGVQFPFLPKSLSPQIGMIYEI